MILLLTDSRRGDSKTYLAVAYVAGRLMRQMRQYLRKLGERGGTSIEFAIVGSVFLMLLLAIFELGYMVFVQSTLDSSARTAARLIRTGQAQGNGNPQTFFQDSLCSSVSSVIGCNNLIYSVNYFTSWTQVQTAVNAPPTRNPTTGLLTNSGVCTDGSGSGGSSSTAICFNAGNCGQIEVVQVTYNYPFFTQWIGEELGGSTQSAFLTSTVVFQNEPFCSGTSVSG
jgi:Flp pilus assembly protein TadG